jgi:hypothetical protein
MLADPILDPAPTPTVVPLKEKRCVNPVCEPGKPCPEFRCPVCKFMVNNFVKRMSADGKC